MRQISGIPGQRELVGDDVLFKAAQRENARDDNPIHIPQLACFPVSPVYLREHLNVSQTLAGQPCAVSECSLFRPPLTDLQFHFWQKDRSILSKTGPHPGQCKITTSPRPPSASRNHQAASQKDTISFFAGYSNRQPRFNAVRTVSIGLLGTCRQIYLEATSILYSTNKFDLESVSILAFLMITSGRPTASH